MEKLATQFVDLGDIRIAYCEAGSGPALILLHGNSESKAIFASYQQVHFAAYRTYALDSRGHGESASIDTQYTFAQYCKDVTRFCRAKGIEQASVVGYSDGGNLALFLASRAPDLFPKIVAISPNYLASGLTDGTRRLIRTMAWFTRISEKLGLSSHRAMMRIDLMLNDIGISEQELAGIHTGLRILYAENDMIKEEHILAMGRIIPGATVRKIAGCNHLNILHKQATIEDIRAYISSS